jgi:LPXTG-motif cell wall-anchored protein
MNIFRVLGMTVLVIGVVLLIFGVVGTQKTGEKVRDELTGHYSNSTMWYIIGGLALIVGGAGLTRINRR